MSADPIPPDVLETQRSWPRAARLFALLTATTVGFSILAAGMPVFLQVRFIGAFERRGMRVEVNPAGPEFVRPWIPESWWKGLGRIVGIYASDTDFNDEDLERMASLPHIEFLMIGVTRVTDAGLRHLVRMPGISSLLLSGTAISDEGLSQVAACQALETLELNDTQVTARGIERISSLPRLETLNLRTRSITDEAVKPLSRLPGLRQLDLSGARITDAGAAELAGMNLSYLSLHGTQVTDEGLAHLSKLSTLRFGLNIGRTHVTPKAVAALQAQHPRWKIH